MINVEMKITQCLSAERLRKGHVSCSCPLRPRISNRTGLMFQICTVHGLAHVIIYIHEVKLNNFLPDDFSTHKKNSFSDLSCDGSRGVS